MKTFLFLAEYFLIHCKPIENTVKPALKGNCV